MSAKLTDLRVLCIDFIMRAITVHAFPSIAIGKYLLMLVLTCSLIPTWAQDDDLPAAQDPTVRARIQAARVAFITNELALTPEEAEKFWPVYREFTEKRRALWLQFRQARLNPDPEKTSQQNDAALVDRQLELKQQELDLEKEYSGRLLKVISAQKVRALPDAERRFRQMVLEQIQRRQSERRSLRDQSKKQDK